MIKKNGKPFKSGEKINTVKGLVVNGKDPKKRAAYIFFEDDSIVNVEQCEVINGVILVEKTND